MAATRNPTQARIRGMLWWPGSTADLIAEIDDQQAAGFDWLWLCGTQYLLATEEGRDRLETIFAEADRRGLHVLFQTYATHDWYARWDLEEEIARNRETMAEAWQRYGAHPSFAAWYIGHEIYLVWGDQSEYCRGLFRAIVDRARELSPRCRVGISPFFILDREKILGDFRFGEPEEYTDWWAETLRRTGIDWLFVQDSGEHISFTSVEENAPFIAAFAEACRRAGADFWVNIETAEMDVPDYAALREARAHPMDAQPWRPVPIPRLRDKLALAGRYSPHAFTWGWEFWRPGRGDEARAYFDAFRALNR